MTDAKKNQDDMGFCFGGWDYKPVYRPEHIHHTREKKAPRSKQEVNFWSIEHIYPVNNNNNNSKEKNEQESSLLLKEKLVIIEWDF